MSNREYSYRQLYIWLQKAAAWEAKTLWTPLGLKITGTWVIYASCLPKRLPKAVRNAIVTVFQLEVKDDRDLNKVIRETIHELQERGIITLTPATEPYTQLTFYHPKA